MKCSRILAVVALIPFVGSAAAGQRTLWKYEHTGLGHLGVDLERISDLSGDGVDDLLAAANWEMVVLSGATGGLLRSHGTGGAGSSTYAQFVFRIGDLNQDGFEDYGFSDAVEGVVHIQSGKSGGSLRTFRGRGDQSFGAAVAGVGDVDGDGTLDLAVSAPRWRTDRGLVTVYSGTDSSTLHEFKGASGELLGTTIVGLGDLDGDSFEDLLVGVPGPSDSKGALRAYSGRDGSLLYERTGNVDGDRLGFHVVGSGDHDLDGYPDVLTTASGNGQTWALSGRDGSTILEIDGIGSSISSVTDATGDGVPDVLIGVQGSRATLVSGANGAELFAFRGSEHGTVPTDWFGMAVSELGRVNGDALTDFTVSAPWHRGNGVLWTFSASDLYLQATPIDPGVGDELSLRTAGGPAHAPVALFLTEIDHSPFDLLVAIDALDAQGTHEFRAIVPPAVSGLRLSFRSFVLSDRVRDSQLTHVDVGL